MVGNRQAGVWEVRAWLLACLPARLALAPCSPACLPQLLSLTSCRLLPTACAAQATKFNQCIGLYIEDCGCGA